MQVTNLIIKLRKQSVIACFLCGLIYKISRKNVTKKGIEKFAIQSYQTICSLWRLYMMTLTTKLLSLLNNLLDVPVLPHVRSIISIGPAAVTGDGPTVREMLGS